MDYQRTAMNEELKARLKRIAKLEAEDYGADPEDHASYKAADAIEQLERQLAERDAEIAKYRDAHVVAWVEVIDSYEGPYHFHGQKLLGVGKHKLIVKPGENK